MGSAPRAMSALTQLALAAAQAQCRGVHPPESAASRSLPTSISTISTWHEPIIHACTHGTCVGRANLHIVLRQNASQLLKTSKENQEFLRYLNIASNYQPLPVRSLHGKCQNRSSSPARVVCNLTAHQSSTVTDFISRKGFTAPCSTGKGFLNESSGTFTMARPRSSGFSSQSADMSEELIRFKVLLQELGPQVRARAVVMPVPRRSR